MYRPINVIQTHQYFTQSHESTIKRCACASI